MGERRRTIKKNQDEIEQQHRLKQRQSEHVFERSYAGDDVDLPMTETPFYPRIEEHVKLLSGIPFTTQRNNFIMQLHQTYGNKYVQRLLESMTVQPKLDISSPSNSQVIQRVDMATCEACGNVYDMDQYGETCPFCGAREPLVSLEHAIKESEKAKKGPKTGVPDMVICEACGKEYDMDIYGPTCPFCGETVPLVGIRPGKPKGKGKKKGLKPSVSTIATCEACGAQYDMSRYGETCPSCGAAEPLVSIKYRM